MHFNAHRHFTSLHFDSLQFTVKLPQIELVGLFGIIGGESFFSINLIYNG